MKKVSELISEERTKLGINLLEVSKKSKINIEQLRAVEVGNWKMFSSSAYLRGVVRTYVRFLGLQEDKFLALLRREIEEKETNFIRKNEDLKSGQFLPKNIYYYFILVAFILFFAFKFLVFIQKPFLNMEVLPSAIKSTEPLVVQGQTSIGALIYLNGEQIFQDEKGKFNEEIYLKKGNIKLELRIVGRNGQELTKKYQIVVK